MSETHKVSINPTAVSPIHETFSLLFKEGEPIIVSSLRQQSDFMGKRSFASIDEAAEFAETLDQDPAVINVYLNLQRLKPGSTTDKRQDVASYVRFLVDIDRKNKKIDGVRVNASEEERDALRPMVQRSAIGRGAWPSTATESCLFSSALTQQPGSRTYFHLLMLFCFWMDVSISIGQLASGARAALHPVF